LLSTLYGIVVLPGINAILGELFGFGLGLTGTVHAQTRLSERAIQGIGVGRAIQGLGILPSSSS
jgi:hypothetical protein